MNHKEYMEWLKENDPILHSELSSNPTGVSGSDEGFGCVVFIVLVLIISVLIFFFAK